MVTELEEVPMSIVGGLDIHRKQLTFDWVDERNGKWERGRIAPADREHLADWLTRFDGVGQPVAFAMEGCTGWRYIAEEMAKAGVIAHLAEPADTSALRGPKRRAKTDKADAKLLRELLAAGRLPSVTSRRPRSWSGGRCWSSTRTCASSTPAGPNGSKRSVSTRAPPRPGRPGSSAATAPGSTRSSTSNCRSPVGCKSTPLWP
jgi:hypothetical protein